MNDSYTRIYHWEIWKNQNKKEQTQNGSPSLSPAIDLKPDYTILLKKFVFLANFLGRYSSSIHSDILGTALFAA
jgi:hypothetical protein